MKKTLKVISGLLVLVMTLCLFACGGTNDPAKLIETALKNSQNMKNYDAHAEITMKISADAMGDEAESMGLSGPQIVKIVMDITAFESPMKAKAVMSIDMLGITLGMDMYIDETYTYAGIMGMWSKMKTESFSEEEGQMQPDQIQKSMELYMKNASNFKLLGEEKVNEIDTYKIEGMISGESIKDFILSSGMLDQVGVTGMNEDMLKTVGDIPMQIWVAKDDMIPVQYYIDMTPMITEMMKNMVESLEQSDEITEEEKQMVMNMIEEYTMIMTISNVNSAEDFEIPEEALNAAETDLNDALMQ